jgi:hypothetical protein
VALADLLEVVCTRLGPVASRFGDAFIVVLLTHLRDVGAGLCKRGIRVIRFLQ